MRSKLNLALRRLVKVAIAAVLAAIVGWFASPEFADVVGTQNAVLLAALLTPILSGLEKGYFKKTS